MRPGSELRALRLAKMPRLSLDVVATALGVQGRSTVHKWESGVVTIPLNKLAAWLDLLDTTPEQRRVVWLAYGIPEADLARLEDGVHGDAPELRAVSS